MGKESHNYDHSHGHHDLVDTGTITFTLIINFTFAIIEFISAILTNSVALYSNSIHDFGDSVILLTTLVIEKYSLKPRSKKYTYGYRRFTLVGSILNSLILFGGSIVIILNIINRIKDPEPIEANLIIWVALLGIAVNVAGVLKLRTKKSVVNDALVKNLAADVLNWIALFISAVVILIFNVQILDSLFSIIIAIGMIISVLKQVGTIFNMLMQAVPKEVNLEEILKVINNFDEVLDCHDLHVWTLDGEDHIASFHITVHNDMNLEATITLKEEIKEKLEEYHVNHATIELDTEYHAIVNGEIDGCIL